MSEMRARVVILQFAYPLFNNPCIINFAHVLAEAGHEVDIFTDSAQPDHWVHDGSLPIRVHVLGVPEWNRPPGAGGDDARPSLSARLRRRVRELLPERAQVGLVAARNEARWLVQVVRYARASLQAIPANEPAVFVGSEVYGLAAACLLGAIRRASVVFWSFELNLWRDRGPFRARATKWLEWLCHRRATFTITQDQERAQLLAADDGIPLDRFVLVPAAARGKARIVRDDYLRSKLGIGPDRRVALYAGTIADWAMCEELALAAASWPEPWVLVLHGWGGGQYLRRLQTMAEQSRRIYVSLDFVPLSEIDRVIGSADAGLALYRPRNTNAQLTSQSSNKLAHYLRCGVPVVTSDFPGFQRIATAYGATIPVPSADEVGTALAKLGEGEDGFRERAVRCYDELYDFDAYVGAVVTRLETLGRSAR